ncbi:helix-turn-helix domain-containing protein [Streptomyces sp. NPDC006551]|uniref:helix-turn-helix domain-containing protein n=1 Tax=Streptomyces sp. NPDC006551 TaxID=3157178 RepID=UPI0033A4EF59
MQYAHASCQLPHARTGVSSPISVSSGDIPCQRTGTQAPSQAALQVPANLQWIGTTTGRIATDAYSWMQAVHWVGGSGLYEPSRNHGPKWGPTTVVIAQEMSALSECRPSVAYLARKLGLSERTVQYHLDMLREAGLLVYRSKGTRVTGRVRLASVFERVIPVEFDEALGIRTVLRDETAPAYQRVPVGIAEQGRKLIGKLAKKAARKVRRKPSRKPKTVGSDCTPMQVGTSTVSTAGDLTLPSESKLASGEKSSPTPKQQKPKARKLNTVGRRYQLARELIATVPWLANAALPRIAWVIRHVADAGWTVDEVRAFLALAADPNVRRPSALLAHRLKGAHLLWDTNAKRTTAVEAWRDCQTATARRHTEWQVDQDGPASRAVQRLLKDAVAAVEATVLRGLETTVIDADTCLALEDLPRDVVIDMRAAAEADPALITTAIETGMSENDARRLYTNRLVDRALRTRKDLAHV